MEVVQGGDEGGVEVGARGGDECQRLVCVCGPVHELDKAVDVFREVLGEDRDAVSWLIVDLFVNEQIDVTDILPMIERCHSYIVLYGCRVSVWNG